MLSISKAKMPPYKVLVVAGWDPSGAAGLAQDLKVLDALGVHGCGAPAALTAQGSAGVTESQGVAPAFLGRQLRALLKENRIGAVKLGLLYGPAQVEAVRAALEEFHGPVVLDPVLEASAGGSLVTPDYVAALKALLLPRVTLLTPNLAEAAALSDRPLVERRGDMPKQAYALLELGVQSVLLKGGHLRGGESPDFYLDAQREAWLEGPRISTTNSRGTGCALASAVAAYLAQGQDPLAACQGAKTFLLKALQANVSQALTGPGPLLWNFKQAS